MALSEWGLPPERIASEWSEEKFALMLQKLAERFERQAAAMGGGLDGGESDDDDAEEISPEEMQRQINGGR